MKFINIYVPAHIPTPQKCKKRLLSVSLFVEKEQKGK